MQKRWRQSRTWLPQSCPSVLREHEPVSVPGPLAHEPLWQAAVVTGRDRVPVSPQVPPKPPQALHAPVVGAAHIVPSGALPDR